MWWLGWVGVLTCPIPRPVKADAVCRLDMERTRSVNGLLANLARLFVPDSERYGGL